MDNTDRAETVHPWLTKQKSHELFRFTASTVDIPTRWNPRAKQQPTGLIACGAMRRRPVRAPSIAQTKKKNQHTMCTGFSWCTSRTHIRTFLCFHGFPESDRFCAFLIVKGNENLIIVEIDGIDKGIHQCLPLLRLGHIQLTETEQSELLGIRKTVFEK